MLTLLPAVDVADGKAVRLLKGEVGSETDYGSPVDAARDWVRAGAEWIHLVDLDAAFGRGSNSELLSRIVGEVGIKVELSGGIRDDASLARALAAGGARTATLVNVVPSPIIEASQHVLAVQAGPEKSVAATKSFIATVALGLHLLAYWNGDRKLQDALQALPDKLERAANADWAAAVEALTPRERLFVVGRGTGLSIAQEAALKCKETCQLQGEAFSAAEVQHGPMAIVHDGFPVLLFAPPDHYQADALQLAAENIADYGLENRIRLVQGDLFQNLQGESFKLILCNPPYVNADSMAALPSEYRAEPEKALGSGPDGMDLITRLLHEAPEHLWPCGVLALEIGHEMPNFQARFPTLTWTSIPVAQGDDRIVLITADDLRQWREQQG